MAQLNNFVGTNLSRETQHTRDYEGPRGWVALTNSFLSKLERDNYYGLGKNKEIAVEVFNSYWVNIPTDLFSITSLYHPRAKDVSMNPVKREPGFVNGKIKLLEEVSNNETAQTDNLFTLSSGDADKISINDTDATLDQWQNFLLVVSSYNGILLKGNAAAGAGVAVCDYLHTQSSFPASGSGYLTEDYLMLQYQSRYTRLTAYTDEVPIDDRYEDILLYWLDYKSLPLSSKSRPAAKKEFEDRYEEVENEQSLLSSEAMRPDKADLIGYNYYPGNDYPSVESDS